MRNLVVISLIGLVVFGLLLFLPAWTFNYWQAWVFIVVFSLSTTLPSVYLSLKNPAALERRMHAGPTAETRTVQRIIISASFLLLPAVMVLSVFDHRFGWSPVPAAVSVIGDALVALGLGITWLVVLQNNYAAANITVETGQEVISTGLYGLVRHPMYVGVLIMLVGIPLALGSWWGLVAQAVMMPALLWRIVDEENLLTEKLPGYAEYKDKVRWRLIPFMW